MPADVVKSQPNFSAIREGDNHAIEDGVRQTWFGLLSEIQVRSRETLKALNRFDKKVYNLSPAADLDNFNYERAGILHFIGSTAVNLSGLIAPEIDGALVIIHVSGSGTITLENDAVSTATNRIITSTGANRARATGKSAVLFYGASRWR